MTEMKGSVVEKETENSVHVCACTCMYHKWKVGVYFYSRMCQHVGMCIHMLFCSSGVRTSLCAFVRARFAQTRRCDS